MKHLSGGDLLRAQISAKTTVGLLAKTYMDKGNLVPDEVVCSLITNELNNLKDQSWLLDGKYIHCFLHSSLLFIAGNI